MDCHSLLFVIKKTYSISKNYIKKHGSYEIPIISKIEKPQALDNIDEIINHSNGLMVARGDLGVEVPAEGVPLIQKNLVLMAKAARIPVIIATQMMESMISNSMPTRAEVFDVANAVLDGTDAVMLSAETAVGSYPVEVVRAMANAAVGAESHPVARTSRYRQDREFRSTQETVALSAMYGANQFPRGAGYCYSYRNRGDTYAHVAVELWPSNFRSES